jgi:hypothetical protein
MGTNQRSKKENSKQAPIELKGGNDEEGLDYRSWDWFWE